MQFVILPSKFVPPLPSPFVIKRKRLFTLLRKNLYRKLILISAGAGYGKTTLSTRLFQSISHTKLFFTIEEEDREPAFFLLSLIKGLQKYFPELNRYSQEILSRPEDSIPLLKRVVKSILNDILYDLKEELYLFFDAERDLPDDSETLALIDSLITYSSKDIHFVFSLRHLFSIESIPKLKLEGNIYEIGEKELAFTEAELQTLLKKIYKHSVEDKEVDMLLKYTGGWIAGIQMVTQKSGKEENITETLKKFAQREGDLAEYFLNRVIKRAPLKIQKFLIQSSIFKELNSGVYEAVFKKKNTKKILQYLEKNHIFTICINSKKGIYRYHPLFRKFLLSLLDKENENKLHRLAGDYFFSQKNYNQALYHYIKARNYFQIISVLKEYAPQLWKSGKYIILKKYLENIPEEILLQSPDILMCRIRLKRTERKYEEIEDELFLCKKGFAKSKKWDKVYEIQIYLMTTKQRKGFTDEAFSIARELYTKLLNKNNKFSADLKLLFLSELAGICYEIQDYDKMEESLERALEYLEDLNNPKWECTVKGNLAIIGAHKGTFQKVYDTLSVLWERYRFQYPFYVQYICANLISCEIIIKEFNDAQFHAEWLLEHSKRYHQDFLTVIAYNFLAKIVYFLSKPKRADNLLKKALNIASSIGNKEALCSVYETFLESHLHNGDYKNARKYLKILEEEKCRIAKEHKFPFYRGKIYGGTGMPEKALKFFKKALKMAKKAGDNFAIAETYWHSALLSHKRGRMEESIQFAKKGLKLIHSENYHFLFSFDKRELSLWKFLLSSDEIDTAFIQNILEKTSKRKELLGIEKHKEERIGMITQPLSSLMFLRFFGNFEIYIGQKKVEIKWHSSKIFSLFAYLAARPGFHTVDSLIENFWPNSPLPQAYSSLYTAISYIRKHYSPFIKEIIENEKKSYRLNGNIPVKRDVEEFETFYRFGKKFENEQNIQLCIENYERARDVYCGHFLENLYDLWAEEERAYYQGKYLRILEILGQLYKKTGDYLEAKNCYLRYIFYEPYEEETYCELFQIFSHLKDRKSLQDIYNRLIKYLDEISSPPSLMAKESYHIALSRF